MSRSPSLVGTLVLTLVLLTSCGGGGPTVTPPPTCTPPATLVGGKCVTPPPAQLVVTCPANQGQGLKVQAVYMSVDGIDRGLDTNGTIENSILSAENWLGPKIGLVHRWDTWNGRLDIVFVRSTMSDAEMAVQGYPASVEGELHKAGLSDSTKRYIVYVEGRGGSRACGQARGKVAMLYLLGECATTVFASATEPPAVWELNMLHELFHVAGAVNPAAPDYATDCSAGHLSDPNDIMSCVGLIVQPRHRQVGEELLRGQCPRWNSKLEVRPVLQAVAVAVVPGAPPANSPAGTQIKIFSNRRSTNLYEVRRTS